MSGLSGLGDATGDSWLASGGAALLTGWLTLLVLLAGVLTLVLASVLALGHALSGLVNADFYLKISKVKGLKKS